MAARLLGAAAEQRRILRGASGLAAACTSAGIGLEAYRRLHVVDKDPAAMCRSRAADLLLSDDRVRRLERDGILVLSARDAVLEEPVLKAARAEADGFLRRGRFSRRANGDSATVRRDLVCWMRETDRPLSEEMLHCARLLRGIAGALEANGYAAARDLQVARPLQLSWYPGDGASGYVRHCDHCDQSVFDVGPLEWLRQSDLRARRVTAILYLNDKDWRPETSESMGDGGALRIFDAAGHADIVPAGGTLVLFDSRKFPHEVRPSQRDRVALTCWITGA
eukprot:TRINITY_DN24578_c0_g1_i1.p1 TRINITY_DN24578_c0_g1~~TRINITY_DN24578_c0_g1_i1.p1  ORF type:complete len:301 (-),score=50.51 TRINITY_DN24578_c0_g1_i1:98-937(-)